MFYSNKYTRWYYSIVNRASCQDRKSRNKKDPSHIYYEQHHIIPKCLGGTNEKNNLVLLTAKEHFIVHILLTKMCVSTKHFQQMINAVMIMKGKTKYSFERYINSRLYESCKNKLKCSEEKREKHKNKITCKSKITGKFLQVDKEEFKNNPDLVGVNYGKKKTKEWCEQHSLKMKGENNPFYGKKHNTTTLEIMSNKISLQTKGKPKTEEWKQKARESWKKRKEKNRT